MANLLSTTVNGSLNVQGSSMYVTASQLHIGKASSGTAQMSFESWGSYTGAIAMNSSGAFHWGGQGNSEWYFKKNNTYNGDYSASGTTVLRIASDGNIYSAYYGDWLSNVFAGKVSTSGGSTIAGTTYFSGGESMQVYGIRGRFANEYIHLYNKVGIGNPNGWGEGQGSTPGYGLSTYGGAVFAYGNNATSSFNGHLRIDRNWGLGDYGAEQFTIRGSSPSITFRDTSHNSKWLMHIDSGNVNFYYGGTVDDNSWGRKLFIPTDGNIWMSWAGDYISNLLGAKQNASTAITTSNIGSQSVSYASNSGALGGLDVGSFLRDDGWNTYPGQDANTQGLMRVDFTYSNNAPYTGELIRFGSSGYSTQFNTSYGNSDNFAFRTRNGDNGTWNTWKAVIHSGNIASQSVSYADESGYSSSSGSVEWTSVQNKPATFPPSTHNHDDRYLVKGGSWYGLGLPGSRWGGFSVSGGEIVFGDGLPNAGQMGILIDGAYLAGENNGFWSLPSDNSWSGRRGMYWDGSNLNFTANSPTALFNSIRLSTSTNNGTISGGGDWGIRFANDNGWIQFGPANNSWTHIYTDKSFYFNQELYVNGTQVVKNSGTWSINISGNAASASSVAWSNVSSKPANWLNATNLIEGFEPSGTAKPSGFYESYLGSGNPTGTWFNFINVRHSNPDNGHGFQIGMSYYDNNLWFRSYQGSTSPSFQSWSRALGTNTDPYPSNMDQYVRTSDSVTFGGVTSPTILVNNQSDNTKGYRIWNTSNTSVSAMFVNSSNQLVIAAGAVDQVNLNKKVYVNGVALGVNVAPSATAGRIDASNDIVAYSSSDERLKHNITPIENALDKVKSLTGVEFDWKPEYKHAHGYEGHDTGIIAQQVQDVMPSAVRTNDTGFLAVRYEKLIGLLIEANKELAARVEELEKKLG